MTATKNLCSECGKSSNYNNHCMYETSDKLAICPTYIKPKLQRKKPLCSSPFKVLSTYSITSDQLTSAIGKK